MRRAGLQWCGPLWLGLIACVSAEPIAAQAPGRAPAMFVSPAGRVFLSAFGGNRVDPRESSRMRLQLRSPADGRRFEALIHHHTLLPGAAIHDPGDGLEMAFHHVVITGKSVDSAGNVALTIVFRQITVRCGPPTCLKPDP